MKKLALILALSFFLPIVAAATSHAAEYSDLAVGDPMGGKYHRPRKRAAKPAATSTTAAPKEEAKPAAAPAEKAPEPAK